MTFEIRKIGSEYALPVSEIEKECFSKPWSTETLKTEMNNEINDFYGAFSGHDLVGYIGSQTVLGECSIYNVAVKKSARRKGAGDLLIKTLLNQCRERGDDCVLLEVRSSNLSAISLYEKNGFVFNGLRKDYYDNPKENAILMKLVLKGDFETEDPIEIWDED